MTDWLSMRDAYTHYAEAVPEPIKFDSFRRWVTQGRVRSRKVGRFKEIPLGCLEGFERALAEPLLSRVSKAIFDNLPDNITAMVVANECEWTNDKGGQIPEGCAVLAGDEDDLLNTMILVLGKFTSINDEPEAILEIGNRTFRAKSRKATVTLAEVKYEKLMVKIDKAVSVASTTWGLDWLAAQGIVEYVGGKGANSKWRANKEFKNVWDELKASGRLSE